MLMSEFQAFHVVSRFRVDGDIFENAHGVGADLFENG